MANTKRGVVNTKEVWSIQKRCGFFIEYFSKLWRFKNFRLYQNFLSEIQTSLSPLFISTLWMKNCKNWNSIQFFIFNQADPLCTCFSFIYVFVWSENIFKRIKNNRMIRCMNLRVQPGTYIMRWSVIFASIIKSFWEKKLNLDFCMSVRRSKETAIKAQSRNICSIITSEDEVWEKFCSSAIHSYCSFFLYICLLAPGHYQNEICFSYFCFHVLL